MHGLLTSGLVALGLLVSPAAQACGGFFCSQVPVDQAGEGIVFDVDPGSGTVEVHVEIAYQGSADDFAWVVPVAEEPELFLSTPALFTQLRAATQATFRPEYIYEGNCEWNWEDYPPMSADDAEADFDTDVDSDSDVGVEVISEGEVGPYRTAILRATSSADLLTWLSDNNYDLPEDLDPVLAPYVADGSYFVALGLLSDRDVGSLAPLGMRYSGSSASIPIQLTSIAATPDMRLEVHVLGGARAVPSNYLHVQINEAAIDWLGWGSNYRDVITQAANEAGGQAFATDYVGSTERLAGRLYRDGQFDTAALSSINDPVAFFDGVMSQGFPPDAKLLDLLRIYIPIPDGLNVDEQSFYNCLGCYAEHLEGQPFDGAAFAAALEEEMVQPLAHAQEMLDGAPKLTRMVSSMSQNEMTIDPMFTFNSDMPDVDNAHVAQFIYECEDGGFWNEADRVLVLPNGTRIDYPSEEAVMAGVPVPTPFESFSGMAAAVIERTSDSGQPEVISDRSEEIADIIEEANEVFGAEYRRSGFGEGCSCNSAPAPASLAFGSLGLLGLLGLRRRSR